MLSVDDDGQEGDWLPLNLVSLRCCYTPNSFTYLPVCYISSRQGFSRRNVHPLQLAAFSLFRVVQ